MENKSCLGKACLGAGALAAVLLWLTYPAHSAEIQWEQGITNCGYRWMAFYVEPKVMGSITSGKGLHYRATGATFAIKPMPDVPDPISLIYFDNTVPLARLPSGHEKDHIDGMTHNADLRELTPPKCGRNRD